MKRLLSIFILILVLCVSLNADWKSYGPAGMVLTSFSYNGYLFAGVGGSGLFRSSDNGNTWAQITNGMPCKTITDMVEKDGTIFVAEAYASGSTTAGIYSSSNNGTSWTKKTSFGSVSASGLVANGTYLFAISQNSTIKRSSDNGDTWTEINSGLVEGNISNIAINGSNVYTVVQRISEGNLYYFYKSSDNGTTWTNTSTTFDMIQGLGYSSPYLFTVSNSGVKRSSDDGSIWTSINTGLTSSSFICISFIGNNPVIGGPSGVFFTNDQGDNWFASPDTKLNNSVVFNLLVDASGVYASTNFNGLAFSSNSGTNWSFRNNGFNNGYVPNLAVCGNYVFGIDNSANGIIRSSDNGHSWENVGFAGFNSGSMVSIGTDIYYGAKYIDPGVFRSTDYGDTWVKTSGATFNETDKSICSFTAIGSALYVGIKGGFSRSTDNGDTWTDVLSSDLTDLDVISMAGSGSYLYAGTTTGLYVSSNNGTSWTGVAAISGYYCRGLYASGSIVLDASEGGLFRSSDYGANWTKTMSGTIEYIFSDGTNLYASSESGLFFSSDNGVSWKVIDLGNASIYPVAGIALGHRLFLGATNTQFGSGYGVLVSEGPILTTGVITAITGESATCSAYIVSDGGSSITARGVVWSETPNPTLGTNEAGHTTGGTAIGAFTATLTGLFSNKTYYVRAYATNADGTSYGNEISFTTIPTLGEWGLIAFGSLIAVIGGVVVWRRFV